MDVIRRGFVLAGGRSRRFGSDKALAAIDGAPAVVALIRRLEGAGLVGAVVWRESHPALGLREVVEPAGELRHPLLGLAAIDGEDAVFVCPCDAVALTEDAIRRLCAAQAVALDSPLVGVWPAVLRAGAEAHARSGLSVRSLAASLPTLDVGPVGNRNEPGRA